MKALTKSQLKKELGRATKKLQELVLLIKEDNLLSEICLYSNRRASGGHEFSDCNDQKLVLTEKGRLIFTKSWSSSDSTGLRQSGEGSEEVKANESTCLRFNLTEEKLDRLIKEMKA